MYFVKTSTPPNINILKVDDLFAVLKGIKDDGRLLFEFSYIVSQKSTMEQGVNKVKISIFEKTVEIPPIIPITDSVSREIDNTKLIDNIKTNVATIHALDQQRKDLIIASTNSDITSQINNQILGALADKSVSVNDIPQLKKKVLKSVFAGDLFEEVPILAQISHPTLKLPAPSLPPPLSRNGFIENKNSAFQVDYEFSESEKQRMRKQMILVEGNDPSTIAGETHRSTTSIDARDGTSSPSRNDSRRLWAGDEVFTPSVKLITSQILPPNVPIPAKTSASVKPSEIITILSTQVIDNIELPTLMFIPGPELLLNKDGVVYVKFELTKSTTGEVISTIIKELNLNDHINLFYTPKKPPNVLVSNIKEYSIANLQIKQVDKNASAVRLYKKEIFKSIAKIDDYSLVGTFDTPEGFLLKIPVNLPKSSTVLFRITAVGKTGIEGFDYTNVVIKSEFKEIKSIVLTATQKQEGVSLEIRNIPDRVISIQPLVKNLSLFQKTYTSVGTPIKITSDIRTIDFVNVIDTMSNMSDNIYEYAVKLVYNTGLTKISGYALLEFILQTPGKFDTQITDVNINSSGLVPDVNFNIKTKTIANSSDIVKFLIEKQDLYDLFKGDIIKEREFVSSLIAHNVQRINLKTGERSDFGIIIDDNFSDIDLKNRLAVSSLEYGNTYRYEIIALVREPESLFESFVKTKIDPITKKSYNFKPNKFLHPKVLKTGTLYSKEGLKVRFGSDPMTYGKIGETITKEVVFNISLPIITNFSVKKFNKELNILRWNVTGEISQIDHFIIKKNVNNVMTIIGKAHSEFKNGNCQYIHTLTSRDQDSMDYHITPIYNDYLEGITVSSNLTSNKLPKNLQQTAPTNRSISIVNKMLKPSNS